MIIASFVRVVHSMKYPSSAYLSCFDNGPLLILLKCNLLVECEMS